MEIEAAGGAATAGLAAAAIEKPGGRTGESNSGVCTDCGAEASGNFCAECGQSTHVHRSLLHLGEELLHGVMHFDARVWRTLPLLVLNPGRLTREWSEGRRTRYVSPLAMFLCTLFIMFFALSFMPGVGSDTPLPERIAAQQAVVTEAERALTEARARAEGAPDGLSARLADTAQLALDAEKARLAELRRQQDEGRTDGLKPGSWQAEAKDMATDLSARGEGEKPQGFAGALLKKLQNPDLAVYKVQQTLYKFAFLLVPLSIPFMALLFLWRRGFTLYDHGVFVLYSLTFMALLLMTMVVAGANLGALGVWLVTLGLFAIPVHVFAQLKGAYGLSVFSALWRTALLLVFCNIALGLFITAIIYLGLGH